MAILHTNLSPYSCAFVFRAMICYGSVQEVMYSKSPMVHQQQMLSRELRLASIALATPFRVPRRFQMVVQVPLDVKLCNCVL